MKPSDCNNRNRKLIEFKKGITQLNLLTLFKNHREGREWITNNDLDKLIPELEKLGLKK
jgi:hypothetical protein